jgi:septal ring factor EnvC (AmiA/AmiB activator)
VLLGPDAGAQSAAALRAKRQQLLKEIEQSSQQLADTRTKKASAVAELSELQRQINRRRALIATLEAEVDLAESRLSRNQEVIEALSGDVERLKQEYAATLRKAYRAKLSNSWLSFLFAADGFNDAVRRWRYLRQYTNYRRRQAQLIVVTRNSLEDRVTQLEARRAEKAELLTAAREQGGLLQSELNKQNSLVSKLAGSEKQIAQTLQEQQRARAALDQSIERAIATEIRSRQERTESQSSAAATATRNEATADNRQFSNVRGRLPWPARGTITRRFGRQPHPDVPSVEVNNSGVDIDAGADAVVKVVHPGEVVATRFVPGYRHMVLVRHGDYFTVYSNLEVVDVTQSQQLSAGAVLGRTAHTGDHLHFELWHNKERLNPEQWLGR